MLPELELELKSFEMFRSLLDELQKQLMRVPFAAAGLLLLGIGWFVSEDVAAFHEVQQTAVHPAAVAGGVVPDAL